MKKRISSSLSGIFGILTAALFVTVLLATGCAFDPEGPSYQGDGSQWELSENQGDGTSGDGTSGDGTSGDGDPVEPGDGTSGDGDPVEPGDGTSGDGEPTDPEVICNGAVVDPDTDPAHCGGCDNACDPAFGSCEGGVCACPAGYEACGSTNRCENTQRDARHCGACGEECAPGMRCANGQCVCRPGLTLCGGECVDTTRDPNHCGSCDRSCGFGACLDSECGNGCGFTSWDCQRPGDDGVHCMSVGSSNSLYCAPSFQYACGEICLGSEVCLAGTLERGCRAYRPGRGCDACPCDDCEETERCRELDTAFGGVLCISE